MDNFGKCKKKKKSNCNDCYVKVKRLWECYKIYDGDTCPVYKKKKNEI
jgi:hypothetical protein